MTQPEAAEQLAALERKAKAWDYLMSAIEAHAEPELKDTKNFGAALDGFIAVYRRQKTEITALQAELDALRRRVGEAEAKLAEAKREEGRVAGRYSQDMGYGR